MKPPSVSSWRCTFCDVDHAVKSYSKAGRLRAFCAAQGAYVYGKDSSTSFVPDFVRAKRKYDHGTLEELRLTAKRITKAASFDRIRGIQDWERRAHAVDVIQKLARYLNNQTQRLGVPPRKAPRGPIPAASVHRPVLGVRFRERA